MKKRFSAIILTAALALSLTACDSIGDAIKDAVGDAVKDAVSDRDTANTPGGNGGADTRDTGGASGAVWIDIADSTLGDDILYHISYVNDKFIASLYSIEKGKRYLAYSADGMSWTAAKDFDFTFDNLDISVNSIAYGGGMYVAVGRGIAYSEDGINWYPVEDSDALFPNSGTGIHDVVWGNGMFVAVGYAGQAAYSADGINWTSVEDLLFFVANDWGFGSASNIECVAYGGGMFVAGSCYGDVAYSPDGINWTLAVEATRRSDTVEQINGIAWGGGIFVAAGREGKLTYSPDAINWTVVDGAFRGDYGADFFDVVYAGERFVAVGCNYLTVYSTDGINWLTLPEERTIAGPGDYISYNSIAYNRGKFVTGGYGGGTSTPLGSVGIISYWAP